MQKLKFILTIVAILSLHSIGRAASPLSTSASSPTEETFGTDKSPSKESIRIAQMKFYSALSLSEYEKLKGKKLNFFEKIAFKSSQQSMKKMLKAYSDGEGPSIFQKIGWLCKGILLGPIALLIGYLFFKDEERELIKWIWFGFAGFVIILLLVLFVA